MKSKRFRNFILGNILVCAWYFGFGLPIYLGLAAPQSMTGVALLASCLINLIIFNVGFSITPYFIQRKQYVQLFFVLFSFLLISVALREMMDKVYYLGVLKDGKPFNQFFYRIVNSTLYLLFSTVFSIYNQFSLNEKRVHRLEKSKLEAELAMLKTQINPHFLFNTLNNIYSLAYLKDDRAASMIAGLSDMLRYMLYECTELRVPLQKEVDFLKSYVDLQAVKAGEALVIDFYVENVSENDVIAPMMLINFVENAFKHSDWKSQDNAWVSVHLTVMDDKTLVFEVANSKKDETAPTKPLSGIGIKNTKQQLELNYPKQYTLTLNNEINCFTTLLKINL